MEHNPGHRHASLSGILLQIRHIALAAMIVVVTFVGCIEESSTIVTFDQTLESATFQNLLLTPVKIYRDGVILDTLPARVTRRYALNRKGVVRHAWQIIPPSGRSGFPAGVSPLVDLGIQYSINGSYVIDNDAISGETLFTPRITNLTIYPLLLSANVGESDYFPANYVIPSNSVSSLAHAPYFYWHSSSNVRLSEINGWYSYTVSRQDTGDARLQLDNTSSL